MVRSARESGETNSRLARSMEEARASASETRTILATGAETLAKTLSHAVDNMRTLSEGVLSFNESLEKVSSTIAVVREASASINEIARETQLVALNASIEAARLGEAGRGFAVIGSAVKVLADQISAFAKQNEASLGALQGTLSDLSQRTKQSATTAEEAVAASNEAAEATRTLQALSTTVQHLTDRIDSMADPVQRNIDSSAGLGQNVRELASLSKSCQGKLDSAGERSQAILDISEDFILFIAQSGIETPDTPVIEICRMTADTIAELFSSAVDRGEMSMSDLFDDNYVPVPGQQPAASADAFHRVHRPRAAAGAGAGGEAERAHYLLCRGRSQRLPADAQPDLFEAAGRRSGVERRQLPQPPHLQRPHRAGRRPQHASPSCCRPTGATWAAAISF